MLKHVLPCLLLATPLFRLFCLLQPAPDIGTQDPLAPLSGVVNAQCGKANSCVEPVFNISQWTSTSDNSYNYATNLATGTFAQPGRAGGAQFMNATGQEVRAGCVLDVILDLDDTAAGLFPESNNCLMVLAIIPGVDFHFYRRDSDGTWSHKPGPRLPTNLDNSGAVITDPRTADIAPYKFARFLGVCTRKAVIM